MSPAADTQSQTQSQQTPLSDEDRMRRRRRLIVLAVALLVVSFGVFSNYGIVTRFRLESRRTQIQDTLASLHQVKDSLRQRSDKLRYDTVEIERLAREKYGMAKPHEEVYIVREEESK